MKRLAQAGRPFLRPDILVGAFLALPTLWAIGYALLYSFGLIGLAGEGPAAAHWARAFERFEAARATALSIWVATAVTALSAALGLSLVLLRGHALRRPIVLAMLCAPLATPVAVAGFFVQQLFSGGGLLARVAYRLGWIEGPGHFPALVNDAFGIGIVLAHLIGATSLLALFFAATARAAKLDEYLELAKSLGATTVQARWRVGLPLLLRKGRSLLLLVFILTLGSFEIPLILGRESPQMFSVLIQRKAAGYNLAERPEAFALAALYFALCASLLALYLKWRRGHG